MIDRWNELNSALPKDLALEQMVAALPTEGDHWLEQYRDIIRRYDAGDRRVVGLRYVDAHVARMRQILAA